MACHGWRSRWLQRVRMLVLVTLGLSSCAAGRVLGIGYGETVRSRCSSSGFPPNHTEIRARSAWIPIAGTEHVEAGLRVYLWVLGAGDFTMREAKIRSRLLPEVFDAPSSCQGHRFGK